MSDPRHHQSVPLRTHHSFAWCSAFFKENFAQGPRRRQDLIKTLAAMWPGPTTGPRSHAT